MDNLGNIITLLTLLLTIILGVSDIRRRRAEAQKMKSDGRLSEVTADTQIMSQIKQASIDLMMELKKDNDDLREENDDLKNQVSYYKRILKENKVSYINYDSRPLQAIKRP